MTRNSSDANLARQHLLSRVRAMMSAESRSEDAARQSSRQRPPPDSRWTDFAALPGFADLRAQRDVADKLGVANPYFLVHDGRAGANTTIAGRSMINFSSYDYLGLNSHPKVIEAAHDAVTRYGVSCSASRLVAGERPVHRALETDLASHYQVDDAIVFVSGYVTNVGVIGHLMGPKDLIVLDAAIHNSALTGATLSGAARRSFPHNDLDALDRLLTEQRSAFERTIIVVEGLYSMDGDHPDLPRLIELKRRHQAWLMVDEAHALGTLGSGGGGLAQHFSVDCREVDIWMGTLSKTLAACGGYIAGSRALTEYLRHTAGAFIYSVGLPPALAAASHAALTVLHEEPERVSKLQANARRFLAQARAAGLDTGLASGTAIAPILLHDTLPAVMLSQALAGRGINVQPIIYPAVPAASSRLRFFISSEHTFDDIDTTIRTVSEELMRLPRGTQLLTGLASRMLQPSR